MKLSSRLDADAVADVLAEHVKAIVTRETAKLLERIAALEAREPLRGEKGEPGLNGKDGASGTDGKDGRDGIDGKDGTSGKDGEKGEPGEAGKEGQPGPPGRDGRDGQPGIAGKDGLNGKDGADGKDGASGIDGKDGFGLDEYTEHLEDGGRILVRKFTSGDRIKEFRHITAQPVYRGVFIEGSTYEPGDCATFGGGIWHCNEETVKAPTETGKSWTLAVKQGRYGKDGKNGKDGERGPPGRDGRNAY